MDLIVAFAVFLSGVAGCMIAGYGLGWAMLLGFFCFFTVGLHRGFEAKQLLGMAAQGGKTAFLVLRIILLIGILTGVWRASGTIAYCVDVGLRFITPGSFVLVAFLLPAVLSLACGSSFGTAGTAGVILMTIAQSGQANLAVTGGAILSGAYFGERLSPASSAAALVSAVTEVEQGTFNRQMWKDSVIPLGLTGIIYGILSVLFPIAQVDGEVIRALEESFALNWSAALPAVVLLVLPWLKFSAMQSIAISCLTAVPVAVLVQDVPLMQLLRFCVMGYEASHPMLGEILSGGGMISMTSTVVIVFLSCAYASIFTGTDMLAPLQAKIAPLARQRGRILCHIGVGLCAASLLCNQVGSIVMNHQILAGHYEEHGLSKEEMARDIGNTVLVLVGLVPWCIACSVPLAMMGSGPQAIPFAVYLYLLPIAALMREMKDKI